MSQRQRPVTCWLATHVRNVEPERHARQMTEVLGGTLALEPHDGPGTTFVVTLAAAAAVDPATSFS